MVGCGLEFRYSFFFSFSFCVVGVLLGTDGSVFVVYGIPKPNLLFVCCMCVRVWKLSWEEQKLGNCHRIYISPCDAGAV